MPRGKTAKSLALIDACAVILAEIQPATVRAVCYQLFVRGLIDSMEPRCTKRVSAQLVDARETGLIPWAWIVDETRRAECYLSWRDPEEYMATVMRSYRRDRWAMQPYRVEIWSEKGTVRGTLGPVLDAYGVTFRVMHGYSSATILYDIAQEAAGNPQPLLVFYVGDWDPSGMHMSEADLPNRLANYGGNLTLQRLALDDQDVTAGSLPMFDAKESDTRYHWFVAQYGRDAWEVDALSPVVLRDRVSQAIASVLDDEAWERCDVTERAEQRSMAQFFGTWKSITGQDPK